MDQRQVIELLVYGGVALLSALAVPYILKSLLTTNQESKNNQIKTGSAKHARINLLLRENFIRPLLQRLQSMESGATPEELQLNTHYRESLRREITKFKTEKMDLFSTYLSTHERVISQCLVFPDELEVSFDDIGGLDEVKRSLRESLCFPFMYSALYNGTSVGAGGGGAPRKKRSALRQEPKGALL